MSRPRKTPEEDVDRLAERIWRHGNGNIKDINTFEEVFKSYMPVGLSYKQQQALKKETFKAIRNKHSNVSEKRVTKIPKTEKVLERRKFVFRGYSKGKLVDATQTYVVYTNKKTGQQKKMIRYRDRKGRFVRKVDVDKDPKSMFVNK